MIVGVVVGARPARGPGRQEMHLGAVLPRPQALGQVFPGPAEVAAIQRLLGRPVVVLGPDVPANSRPAPTRYHQEDKHDGGGQRVLPHALREPAEKTNHALWPPGRLS